MNTREKVPFPEKDQPLREEVRILGALLGEVLIDQEGQEFFDEVEASRHDAIARRQGDLAAEARLVERIAASDPDRLVALTRAFSSYFALVNQAERIHRIRRRREYHRPGHEPQRGSMLSALRTLRDRGLECGEAAELLESIRLSPVFTAHPTEAVRPAILVKELRVARALMDGLERRDLTPSEDLSVHDRIVTEITTGWQTAQNIPGRPEVAAEVDQVIYFLTTTIYAVLPRFIEDVEDAFASVYPEAETSSLDLSRLIQFGSWVGGDMDGNPNVGPDTLLDSLVRQRTAILAKYRREVLELADRLTQTEDRVVINPQFRERWEDYRNRIDRAESPAVRSMPYRSFLGFVAERMAATESGGPCSYAGPEELISDLELLEQSLLAGKGARAGRFRVLRFLRRVRTFGFHLAALDVRQDALLHRKAVGELLGRGDFLDLSPKERADLLLKDLSTAMLRAEPRPESLSPETTRTLDVFEAIGSARKTFGAGAVGIYIVSMAREPDDALAVLYLARRAGLERDGEIPIDVAPLFETVDDLEVARNTLQSLFDQPFYKSHLDVRGEQHVMLGYSDSSKDSGISASRWALYRVQEELRDISVESGVSIKLFHGRGGTVSRGGSKPYSAILSQPPGTVQGHLRVTEQGEVLQAKYGLRGIALRSFEVVSSAVAEASWDAPEPNRPQPGSADDFRRSVADRVAKVARATYRGLVHDEADFIPYFRAATPIDVIERLAIGSRPPSRREQKGVNDLRAIPWVFSWTQSRHVLPGWFGVGSGLEAAVQEFGLEALRVVAREWPYMTSLLGDVEMVLAKADLDIARRFSQLAGPIGSQIFPIIQTEFERTRSLILEIQETKELLERDPVLRRAILLRNPYVDPMSLAQVDLLERWRSGDRTDTALETALFVTVKGIARGLQNTG